MKKAMNLLLSFFLVLTLTGCGSKSESADSEKGLSVVTTIFPLYEWCREVLGENPGHVELSFLLDSGTDLHSYQPTAGDMVTVSGCDLFLYIGGESDAWVKDALSNSVNPQSTSLNMMELLSDSVKEEEIREGMESEEEEEEKEYDEHVWLSLNNAETAVRKIADVLSEKDPQNSGVYSSNAEAYCAKLQELDEKYRTTVQNGQYDTLVFADRFPFRYLMDDYGIQYYAAFAGCSAETEASFETVRFLAGKVDELGLPAVMTIEKNDEKMARTVIENTSQKNRKILHLDSMQSVTQQDSLEGTTYLSVMEDNLNVLKEALAASE
jgi:zinc transport system substrate-binding protein